MPSSPCSPTPAPAAGAWPPPEPAGAVLISEVGPRDGLQSVKAIMSTAHKQAWIDTLAGAGVREIEVGSFVPADRLPQLADTAEIVRHARRHAGLTVMALVPNLHGAQAAVAGGVHKLSIPVSASEAHSLANVRRTREQMIEEVRRIVMWRAEHAPGVAVEVGLSTAFRCSLQGRVPADDVVWVAAAQAAVGVDEIGLSDTSGMANPAQVRQLFTRVRAAIGSRTGAAHLHNTRGLGLANALAAFDVGVRSFDASLGGLGGCPYAPGASGNVVTEDLVFMWEAMGVCTGIDLHRLIAARDSLRAGLPGEPLYGMTPEAGLPLGFVATTAAGAAHVR